MDRTAAPTNRDVRGLPVIMVQTELTPVVRVVVAELSRLATVTAVSE